MIDFCDFVISYVTVPFGGAFRALKYAENQKKKIFYLGG